MKKLKAEDGQHLWKKIVKSNLGKEWCGVDICSLTEKLLKVKFTYNGEMKKTSAGSCIKLNKHYHYAKRHFPALVVIFENMRYNLEHEIKES